MDAERIVSAFNACINARDLAGLSDLMTDNHRFIDTADNVVSGKAACVGAWRGFFAAFSDYRNVFERIEVRGDDVTVAGRSECSDARLQGPALWSAKVAGEAVVEWRVWEDTPDHRATLGLS